MANDYMDYFEINGVEVHIQDHGRDKPNGVPVLDPQGKLPTKYIPDNYANFLKVDPRNPYNDNFASWVAELSSNAYKYRGQTWNKCTNVPSCYYHSCTHFKDIDIVLLTEPNTSEALNENEGCYWTDNWSEFNKATNDMRIRPTSIDASSSICVVGSVHSTTNPRSKGGVAWTEDGKNWFRATGIDDTSTVYNVKYVPFLDLWVCMVSGVGIYWSEDGKSWTQGTGGTTSTSIAYLGVFSDIIIASYSSTMWYSEDGKNWAQCTADGTFSHTVISSVIAVNFRIYKFSGGYYSSAGDWSLDGKSWHVNASNPKQVKSYLLELQNGHFYGNSSSRVSDVTSEGPIIEALSSADVSPVPCLVVYNEENGKYYAFQHDTSTSTIRSYSSEDGVQFHLEGSTSDVGPSAVVTRAYCCKGLFILCSESSSLTNGKWACSVDGKNFFTPAVAFSAINNILLRHKKWYALATRIFETGNYVWIPPEVAQQTV